MTAAEIVMKRDDLNIAWGFRLTGGSDLGTPFYVVKVLGRGHAERAGLRVGDMVYAINHKYVNNLTHKDAQNEILHTGDTLILNIKRGHQDPSGRGTPLPDFTDPLMGITVPPETPRPKPVPPPPYQPPPAVVKVPTPPESETEEAEDTVASFNVKINPKGRIAEIEELPVTPPPSPTSRARSRSRSASKDRRRSASSKRESAAVQNGFIPVQNGVDKTQNGFHGVQNGVPGPGETFTYSKEVITQYSTVLSASEQNEGNVSETVNESFVIHGGSTHKMEDVLSPEDIERDIFEEKMEEKIITELLTGEAEVLEQGIVGINFQKIIPRTDFIKDSSVFKELQGEVLKKEESEEEQIKKDPNKRFSTFLQTPKRPIPKPKTIPPPTEDLPWKQCLATPIPDIPPPQKVQETVEQQSTATEITTETIQSTTTYTESVQITEEMSFTEIQETEDGFGCCERLEARGDGPIIVEAISTENVSEEKVQFKETIDEKNEEGCSIEEMKEKTPSEGERSETQSTRSEKYESSTTVEYKSEFERQLAEIQKQIEAIQQLPSVLQANLLSVQEQLAQIVAAKAAADINEKEAQHSSLKRDSMRSNLSWKIDVTVEEDKGEYLEEDKHEETTEESEEITVPQPEEQDQQNEEDKRLEMETDFGNLVEHTEIEQFKNIKNKQLHQEEDPSVRKPHLIRNFPKSAERPIVLPGGRKWYKPQDAYNEDFIAETIIHQSEVLVGTTIGLNFLKYEPPKFDAANSAVYRMIQEMEGRANVDSDCLPIACRPEKVLAEDDYFPPISKRHFFAARLTEQGNENVEKILNETNEQQLISV